MEARATRLQISEEGVRLAELEDRTAEAQGPEPAKRNRRL